VGKKASAGMENEAPSPSPPCQLYGEVSHETLDMGRRAGAFRTMASLPSLRAEVRECKSREVQGQETQDKRSGGLSHSASVTGASGSPLKRYERLMRRQSWMRQTATEKGSPRKSLTTAVERQFGTAMVSKGSPQLASSSPAVFV
jgi:hypothetical protein